MGADLSRWGQGASLDVDLWHRRTEHCLRLLGSRWRWGGPIRLLDIGCGAMYAEKAAQAVWGGPIEYLPVDCAKRDERTLVLDLDDSPTLAALPEADVAHFGGVLEYMERPEELLIAAAAKARFLVVSYCYVEAYSPASTPASRDRTGWKNAWPLSELIWRCSLLGKVTDVDLSFAPAPRPVAVVIADRGA